MTSVAAVAGLVAMLVATFGVGIYARRYARTTSDFLVAARAVRPAANAAAISGEYLSAASFLGVAGLVMKYGYDVLWYPVGYAAGYLVLLVFIAGPLRRFGAYTIPDFAEGRFDSPRFRRLAVGMVIVVGLFYTLPQMKAAGITVASAAGVPYGVGVAVMAAVVATIVMAGGMRGVTVVQAMQFTVKLFAIAAPAFVLMAFIGSPGRMFAQVSAQHAASLPNSTSQWLRPFGDFAGGSGEPLLFTYSLIVAILCGTMGLPHILVRFYTNPDARTARRTAWLVLVLVGVFYLWPPLYGVAGRLRAPQLYTSGLTDSVVLLLPRTVGPPVVGQALAAITAAGAFAAFAATLSGLLISLAGALGHDIYGRWLRPQASGLERSRAFRASALVAGITSALLGLLVEGFDINVLVGWAFAIAASSFFPLLVLGIWWRGLTTLGAALGTAVGGLAATLAIVTTMLASASPALESALRSSPALAVILAQPAIFTLPLAGATMVVVSLVHHRPPLAVGAKMLQLHIPDRLGLRKDYIP